MGYSDERDKLVYRSGRAVRGISLLEVLVGLLLASVVVLALYETLTSQQRSYFLQDDVSELQQNLRVALERISRDLTMAGFGKPTSSIVNGEDLSPWYTSGSNFFPVQTADSGLDVIGCFAPPDGVLSTDAAAGANSITIAAAQAHNFNRLGDERPDKCSISIGGRENFQITNIGAPSSGKIALDLSGNLFMGYKTGTEVYVVRHTTYSTGRSGGIPVLRLNEHRGAGNQPFCQYVTDLDVTVNVGMVTVAVTGQTRNPDRTTGKYITSTVSTSVMLRNPWQGP